MGFGVWAQGFVSSVSSSRPGGSDLEWFGFRVSGFEFIGYRV